MPKEKSCKSYDKIQYSKKVINLFLHPKNVGEIKNASGVGEVGNPICGDVMRIYIKVSDDKIVDIKFKTFACASAISTSSMMTKMVKGKTLAEAKKLTFNDITKKLGGLPDSKLHCSALTIAGLKKAIENYEEKN